MLVKLNGKYYNVACDRSRISVLMKFCLEADLGEIRGLAEQLQKSLGTPAPYEYTRSKTKEWVVPDNGCKPLEKYVYTSNDRGNNRMCYLDDKDNAHFISVAYYSKEQAERRAKFSAKEKYDSLVKRGYDDAIEIGKILERFPDINA